jgi:hypothetical protein
MTQLGEDRHNRLLELRDLMIEDLVSMAMVNAPLVAVVVSAGGQVGPRWWPSKVPTRVMREVPPSCRASSPG